MCKVKKLVEASSRDWEKERIMMIMKSEQAKY
jgi:hypothetical protein